MKILQVIKTLKILTKLELQFAYIKVKLWFAHTKLKNKIKNFGLIMGFFGTISSPLLNSEFWSVIKTEKERK